MFNTVLYDEVTTKLEKLLNSYRARGYTLISVDKIVMETPMICLFFTMNDGIGSYKRTIVLVSDDYTHYQEYEGTSFGGQITGNFE